MFLQIGFDYLCISFLFAMMNSFEKSLQFIHQCRSFLKAISTNSANGYIIGGLAPGWFGYERDP